MKKLNQRKIRWIIREMEKGERSVYRIAKTMDVTPRWIRELYYNYKETKQFPFPKKPGRRPRPVSNKEKEIVLKARKEHPLSGAIALEKIIDSKGTHIGHNRIHRILKQEGLSRGNHGNNVVVNGYVTNVVIVIASGMLTGLRKNRIRSSFLRMTHLVL